MDPVIGIQAFGQYDAARRGLEKLAEDFDVAKTLPLGHQLITPFDGPWTEQQWTKFIQANTYQGGEWQQFEVFPGGQSCSRFFGSKSLPSFERLAGRGMKLLRQISRMMQARTAILPDGLVLRLSAREGYYSWLRLLYETARAYSTHFLQAKPGFWGVAGQFPGDETDPAHPFYEELSYDLFESSAAAIALWLSPTEAVCEGDRNADTPIYLPPEPEENGPCPIYKFRLWGKCYTFTPKAWSLLAYLYGKGPVKKEEAMAHIYGEAEDNEGAFLSTAKRLQSELADQGCPAEVHTKGEYIHLEVFNEN
jgi:hypothetical protein